LDVKVISSVEVWAKNDGNILGDIFYIIFKPNFLLFLHQFFNAKNFAFFTNFLTPKICVKKQKIGVTNWCKKLV